VGLVPAEGQSNAAGHVLDLNERSPGRASLKIVMFRRSPRHRRKSLTTRSRRNLALIPQAVANLRQVTVKSLSAIFRSSTSGKDFDFA